MARCMHASACVPGEGGPPCFAADLQVDPSGDTYISIVNYMGRFTHLINVRYELSGVTYTTMQRNSIMQITNDIKVPPTAVYQVCVGGGLPALLGAAGETREKLQQRMPSTMMHARPAKLRVNWVRCPSASIQPTLMLMLRHLLCRSGAWRTCSARWPTRPT